MTTMRTAPLLLLTGPVIWFAYFLLAYFITGTGCSLGYAHATVAGLNLARVLVVAAGVLAVVVILAASVPSWRRYRGTAGGHGEPDTFLDLAGLLLNGASLVGVVWLAATVLINPVC